MKKLNAVTHGIHKSVYTLRNENDQAFRDLEQQFLDEYQPHGPTEHCLVDQLIMARWRLSRIWAASTATLDLQMDQDAAEFAALAQSDEPTRLAFSFGRLANSSASPELLQRYETHFSRIFERSLRRLEALQQRRRHQLKAA